MIDEKRRIEFEDGNRESGKDIEEIGCEKGMTEEIEIRNEHAIGFSHLLIVGFLYILPCDRFSPPILILIP